MPYKFQFRVDGENHFECELESMQCTFSKANGQLCENRCVMGVPLCWVHLLSRHKLRIKPTDYPPMPPNSKGLFAVNNNKDVGKDDVIFKKNAIIFEYNGEYINTDELERRYGTKTGPYAMTVKKNCYIDAACKRGIGSLVNHKFNKDKPNVKFIKKRNPETKKMDRIQLIASREIKNNEEIFVNYGFQYRLNERGVSNKTVKTRKKKR
jgi:hypothetical protein